MKKLAPAIATVVLLFITIASPARAAVSPGVGIVTSNLLFYYDAANPNSYQATTSWNDLSGNNVTATINNSVGYSRTATGSFLSLSGGAGNVGTNPFISLPTLTYDFSSGFSVSFYGSFGTAVNDWERIFDFGNGSQAMNFLLGRETTYNNLFYESWNSNFSKGICRSPSSGAGSITTSTPMTNQFITLTVNSSGCQFYVDGNSVTTTKTQNNGYTNVIPESAQRTNTWLGRSNWSGDTYMEGRILRFAMYNRALSASEVTQNYNSMTDVTYPTLSAVSTTAPENQVSGTTISASESGSFAIIGGTDSSKFNINSSTGELTFKSAPNFEAPDDSNADGTYVVTIREIDLNGNHNDLTASITLTNVNEYSTLTLPVLGASPAKGVPVTITVTPTAGGTAGKVSFFMANKRIVGCYKKSYSGSGNVTCTWKPTVQGFREISVTFSPNGSEYAASTSKKSFFITKRTTTR
jgi:hypothetical protein